MLFREREKKNTGMERREWHRELQHLKQRFSMCGVIVRGEEKKKLVKNEGEVYRKVAQHSLALFQNGYLKEYLIPE